MTSPEQGPVLVAGASGFVGRRLVPDLVEAGHDVRAMTRHPDTYDGRGQPGPRRRARRRLAAGGARRAAARRTTSCTPWTPRTSSGSTRRRRPPSGRPRPTAGVQQIVYLGGLGSESDELSVAPAQPPRGRGPARRRGGAGDRAARRHHRRQRRHLVGDDPPARRPPAGDGHPAVGAHQDPADRGGRRGALPRRRARPRRGARPGLRDRRPRGAAVRHDAAPGGHDQEPAAGHRPGAPAHARDCRRAGCRW